MIKGNCLCGEVRYEYRGAIQEVVICHCEQCKRAQGTPFATNAPIQLKHFAFTRGVELLKAHFSSPNKKRVFCGNCGSPLYSQRNDLPNIIRLRLGTVTEGDIPEPHYEIYCESKSTWCQSDGLRDQYTQGKPPP